MKPFIKSVFLVFIFGVFTFLIYDNIRPFYFDPHLTVDVPKNYPVFGIDISHHQGKIDFNQLFNNKFSDSLGFFYIKATEGINHQDRNYDVNAEGIARLKGSYGFYHFYQPQSSAMEQANHFCNTIGKYNFKLKPVVDIEMIGDLNNNSLCDSLIIYMDRVEELLAVRPLIYTFHSFYLDYLDDHSIRNEIYWIAKYKGTTHLMKKENFIIWQFTELGRLDGVNENVDLNVAKENFYREIGIKR